MDPQHSCRSESSNISLVVLETNANLQPKEGKRQDVFVLPIVRVGLVFWGLDVSPVAKYKYIQILKKICLFLSWKYQDPYPDQHWPIQCKRLAKMQDASQKQVIENNNMDVGTRRKHT